MLKTRFIVLSLLVLSLMLTACGGGTSGLVADDLSSGDTFKAVRYADDGSTNTALNDTVNLQTVATGDMTTVTVSVNDSEPMWGVAMDINYDANHYTPVSVEFNGLVETDLSFSCTKVSGLIGASQVDINGTAVRSGEFATITFLNEANRTASAAGDVLPDMVDFVYAPEALTDAAPSYTLDAETLEYSFNSAFAQGDGNRDGFITAADITPIGQYWGEVMISDTDFTPAIGDYSRDGMITASDLAPLGQRYDERVTGFEFWAFDADDTTTTGTMVGDAIEWTSGTATDRSTGEITDWGEVFRVWTGTLSEDDLPADTDEDGNVYVALRAINADGSGDYTATTAVEVGPEPPDDFVINDFVFQIENATGGSAGADDLFADGDTAVVPANADITLNVVEISGTYGGTAFVGDDGTAPTTEYAAALAAFAADVNWTPTNAGDADMQMTADVLVLSGTSGTGVTGVVFPDNDRGSATPEGALGIDVAVDGTFIPTAFAWSVDIDVELDPAALRVVGIMSSAGEVGDGNYYIDAMGSTMLTYDFDWGTEVPTNMAEVGVTLYDLTGQEETLVFTHTTEAEPGNNEYVIIDHPDQLVAEKQLHVNLGGGNVVADNLYTIRLQVPPYNSVNDPGLFLVRGDYPDEVEMMTIPKPSQVLDDDDDLWIFYPEPKLRRNPRSYYDIAEDEIVKDDAPAYDDIIKTTGDEFVFENDGTYPKVVVKADVDNNTDPTTIDESTPDLAPTNVAYKCPGFIILDIEALTTEGGPGEDPVHYDYRVLGAGAPLGYGEFTVIKELMDPQSATGVDFGLNIFDGDLTVDTRDYSDKQLDATTANTDNPDVLFVEFGEGDIGNYDELGVEMDDNAKIVLSGSTGGDTELMWDPRLAINADGTMICIHAFSPLDFESGLPGWTGHIDTGDVLNVNIYDKGSAGALEYTFADTLVVVGANPHDS